MRSAPQPEVARCPGLLLVEDDPDVQEALGDILADAGWDVACAFDGAAALLHLRAAARLPCVILLDLMMPGMNGYQFRAAQLEDPALARIPVILLTADVMIKEKAAALRVAACLRKPVGVAELCAAIHRHCRCE